MKEIDRPKAPVGIVGGTYDMPTNSHKEYILAATDFADIVYVVPCGRQNGKNPVASPWDRVAMVGVMVAELLQENPQLEGKIRVWTGEIEKSPSSYQDGILQFGENKTIETVEEIERMLGVIGQGVIFIGEDLAEKFKNWERPGERNVWVYGRRGYAGAKLESYMEPMGNHRKNGSSHRVRMDISEGKPFAHRIPRAVGSIIRERKLYGYSGIRKV